MRANGQAIRTIRELAKISLRDIEMATSIHRGYLSELERGLKDARPHTLTRIAAALDCPVSAISRDWK